MELASLLRTYRSRAGLTQEDLAERTGISVRAISDAERGLRRRIYRDTADRLADAFELTDEERQGFSAAARGGSRATQVRRNPVPAPPNRLIGRDREEQRLLALTDRADLRLITICGPGGVGKTRLALHVAAQLPDVTYVDLGDLADPALVLPAIARAVGVPASVDPSAAAIAEALDGRDAWILLDTVEHVLEAAPDLAGVLAAAPRLRILATSREALRIRGEHEVVLPPLDIDPGGAACDLFRERAQAVQPDEPMDDDLVEQICRKVNGIPLAVELAAARVKHLPLPRLNDELDHALAVLTQGPRDLPLRQQTMRDTVAWSYDLLTPREQQVFRNLCTFPGGWQLDLAVAVAGDDAVPVCHALVDRSLVVREGERWDLYDVIREFGLEAGPDPDAPARLLQACIELAEQAESAFGKAGQQSWVDRVATERATFGAALHLATENGDGTAALRIAGAIWRYWQQLGAMTEGRKWLREALALPGPADLRARGWWGLAWLAYHQDGIDEVRYCAAQLLATTTDDPAARRNALTIAGLVAMADDDAVAAQSLFEQCVELLVGVDDGWLLATSYLNLGIATAHLTEPDAARMLSEARRRYLELGDSSFATRATLYLGLAALLRSDLATAVGLARDAVITFWELDDAGGSVEAIELAAGVCAAQWQLEPTAVLAGAASSARRSIGTRPLPLDGVAITRYVDRARAGADGAQWEQWWSAGAAMGLAEAAGLACEVLDRVEPPVGIEPTT